MTMLTTFGKRILTAAIMLITATIAWSQNEETPTAPGEPPKPTKWVEVKEEEQKLIFFQGFTISADLFGIVQGIASDYGALEGALRLNLKNTYFPIAEIGYAKCDKLDNNTNVHFNMKAPYIRIGVDYNLLKDKFQDNRLYAGIRYGLTKFTYDMSGPSMTDPIWGGSSDFNIKGIDCTSHWMELVFGAQVKVTGNFHMGWSVRYKRELSSTKNDFARPSYIPGYGRTTGDTCWGGTYNLIFDLNWGMKKSHKRRLKITSGDITPTEPIEPIEEPVTTDKKETSN